MAVITGKAPGKIILFGEHAVVYGQPAIAIPVFNVKATTHVFPDFASPPGQIRIQALDIGLDAQLSELRPDDPLAVAVTQTLRTLQPKHIPAFTLQISSTIPIASGLGSGAAVAVAIIRGVSAFMGQPLSNDKIAAIAYEVEKIHHGNPSGIDNNVVSYGKPVYYQRGKPLQFLEIKEATHWVIADTGEYTPTHDTVSAVSNGHAADPQFYENIFEKIGAVSQQARERLIKGELFTLGQLLNENQEWLRQLDVSSPKIEKLVQAALSAGALGAKLSGGGRGGNIIALSSPLKIQAVKAALVEAGAVRIISSRLHEGS